MNQSELLSSLVNSASSFLQSLVWPISIVLIIKMFKEDIKSLFKMIKKVKVGESEFHFNQEFKEIEKIEKKIDQDSHHTQRVGVSHYSEKIPEAISIARDIKDKSPQSSILIVWGLVEEKLNHISDVFGFSKNRGASSILNFLKNSNNVDVNHYEILKKLYKLRNIAAHRSAEFEEITSFDAESYIEFILPMLDYLDVLIKKNSRTNPPL